jgi:hypothetical protein
MLLVELTVSVRARLALLSLLLLSLFVSTTFDVVVGDGVDVGVAAGVASLVDKSIDDGTATAAADAVVGVAVVAFDNGDGGGSVVSPFSGRFLPILAFNA